METYLGAPWSVLGWTVVNALAIYVTVIVLVRLQGLRSFAKMSGFDFASTVAVGSIMATTAASSDIPLAAGATAVATIFVAQLAVGRGRRWARVRSIVDNEPLLLMAGEDILRDNLRIGQVTEDDLRAKLREANVLHLGQVRAVVLETTGDISVLHGDADGPALQPYLLDGVRGAEDHRTSP